MKRGNPRTSRWLGVAGLAMLAMVAACSPGVSEAPGTTVPGRDAGAALSVHPESGLEIIPVTVTSGKRTHRFQAEIALSQFEQAKGMMFRTAMRPDEGMLFPFDKPRQASFWMRNTVIPLDIIFIGENDRILNIAANTVPYSEVQLLSEGEAAAVLELVGGRAAQLGIKAGDQVQW